MKILASKFSNDSGSERWTCLRCGADAPTTVLPLSVHVSDDHAGFGQVVHISVPFCASCDPAPSETGCIHTPMFGKKAYELYLVDYPPEAEGHIILPDGVHPIYTLLGSVPSS